MPKKKTIKKKMWVEMEAGTELSDSRKSPGKKSPLLRNADGLAGQAVLSEIDEDEEDDFYSSSPDGWEPGPEEANPSLVELAETITELLTLLTEIAMSEAASDGIRWWKAQATPAIKATARSARSKLAKVRKQGQRSRKNQIVFPDDAAIPLPPITVDAAPVEEGPLISSDEAQHLLLAALIARASSDEQMQVLRNSRIQDADQILDIKRSLAQYTPSQVEEQVRYMLEANPNLLDEFAEVWVDREATAPARLPKTADSQRRLSR